jgi:type IV secretory pathway VirB10-like protein
MLPNQIGGKRMATKDPFSNIPPIQPNPSSADQTVPGDFVEETQNLRRGSAPKNILANIQKIAIPLLGLGILVWLFLPDNRTGAARGEKPEAVVDRAVQVSQTSALLDSLQDDAKKAPAPPQQTEQRTPGAGVGAGPYGVGGPPGQHGQMPLPMRQPNSIPGGADTSAANAEAIAQAAAKQKREEDIRASPLEAPGTFALITDSASSSPASNVSQLQAEMARLAAQQSAAGAALTNDAKEALAALSQKPATASSKNANQEFLSSQATAGGASPPLTAQRPADRYMVQEAKIIRAVLMPEVSSDLPGRITARVTSDVYDSIHMECVLIPAGSELMGVYNNEVVIGQESTLIAMTKLRLPDGSTVSLGGASASDMMGKSGLKASVNNHFWKMFSSSFVIGASSLFLSDKKTSTQTTSNGSGTTTTGTVAGTALNDVLQTLMNRNKNIQPTLTNGYGQEFTFMVAQDMALNCYRRR